MRRECLPFLVAGVLLVATQSGCSTAPVMTGIEVLEADGFKPLVGKRVGLITNQTGVTRDLRTTIDILHQAPEVELVALFGPEHGVRGDIQGGVDVGDAVDKRTGVRIYSLFGDRFSPTSEMVEGIDVLVFDIQDIGCRSYTFISSMAAAMEGAAKLGVPFMVLDRPNPITGVRMEGPILDMSYKSFVGYLPIPYVHGLTVGELALMANEEGWLADGAKCDLTVISMKGWNRSMWFDETGLPWVLSSPHIPQWEMSMFYPATGIMGELRTLNEGCGYTLPFQLCGAPGIDAAWMADTLNARELPGVIFRPIYYVPYYTKYAEQYCGGVQIHVVDRDKAHLSSIQFHLIDVVRSKYPELKLFGDNRDKTFDKVCGTDAIRNMFLEHRPVGQILGRWDADVGKFAKQREPYLLYD